MFSKYLIWNDRRQHIGAYITNTYCQEYPRCLEDELPKHFKRNLETVNSLRLIHNKPPPHFGLVERQFLDENYPDRWIGIGDPISQIHLRRFDYFEAD